MREFSANQFNKVLGAGAVIGKIGDHYRGQAGDFVFDIPIRWMSDERGEPQRPWCVLSDEDRSQLREILSLDPRVHDCDIALGFYRNGAFRFASCGASDDASMMTLFLTYQPGTSEPELEQLHQQFIERHHPVKCCLRAETPIESDPARGSYLAQSYYVMPVPPELARVLNPPSDFAAAR